MIRKWSLYLACVVLSVSVQAQVNEEDTVRTVILETINFYGKQKNQQDRLFDYYANNKSGTTESILARLPEVSLIRRGNYGMEPVIRSYSGNQVNLLLDGMRIHGACTDKMDPASIYIEPVNLQSIEIKTNGSSIMQGSSIGGSINMKLNDVALSPSKEWRGHVQTGFHTVSKTIANSAALQYSTEKFGIRGTGSFRKADNYKNGKGEEVLYSGYSKINFALHAKYQLNETIHLKADYIGDEGHDIGYAALPMDVGYARAKIGSVSITREDNLSKWREVTAKLYANAIDHYMDDSQRPDLPIRMDMPGTSRTTGFFVEGKRLNGKQQLEMRVDVSYTALHASMTMYQAGEAPMYMLTWPDNGMLQSGISAQYNYRIDSLTAISLNGRADNFSYSLTSEEGKNHLAVFGHDETEQQYFIPSVSLQLSRKISGKIRSNISLMANGRAATASELYGFYLFNQFDGYDYIGNPQLKAERGLGAEWGLSYQSRKIKYNLSVYGTRIQNYIIGIHNPVHSAMTIGARGVKMHENLPYATVWGGEASAIYSFSQGSTLISTIKNHFGKDHDRNPLPMMAPLKWVSSYRKTLNKLWLQGEVEVAAARKKVNMATGEQPTAGFELLNLRAGYLIEGNQTQWELNCGVENIFNRYYREHLDWGNIPRQGRNIYIQLEVRF